MAFANSLRDQPRKTFNWTCLTSDRRTVEDMAIETNTRTHECTCGIAYLTNAHDMFKSNAPFDLSMREVISKRLRSAHKSLLAAVVDREGFSAQTGAESAEKMVWGGTLNEK